MKKVQKPLIILTGPTAVGKTKLSISLAKAVNGEIISADSMQVYRHMDIGSAKIRSEEMQGVKHYLIDELEPENSFHVVEFQKMAKKAMEEIYAKGKIPILAGGTGFYIQAIVKDIDFSENTEAGSYRKELEAMAKEKGAHYLHEMLEKIDEVSAQAIHENNVKRVIRALEYYHLTLNDEREKLYQRIEQRIDEMLENGLIEEVKALKRRGCTKDMVSMQGLGYKEILSYLDGEYSLEEAVYILKRDTRHFAKRQITWFKREHDVIWLEKPEFDYDETKILNYMLKICKEKGIL